MAVRWGRLRERESGKKPSFLKARGDRHTFTSGRSATLLRVLLNVEAGSDPNLERG